MFTVSVEDGALKKEYGVWRDKTTGAVANFIKLTDITHTHGTGTAAVSVMPVIVHVAAADATVAADTALQVIDGKFYDVVGNCATAAACKVQKLAWVQVTYPTTGVTAGNDPKAVYTTKTAADVTHAAVATLPDTKHGHKNTHVAVEFNIGGVTPYLGHSTKKENGAMGKKTKTTHYGVRGGLGDTGINFLVAARNVKPDGGAKTSPWLFNLSKNLGGGATVIFEHANYDNNEPGNKETAIGLHVTF